MSASLAGRHLVVSAGPTFEDIDPVRFIGNRSSGKMGFAIAAVAAARGARVTLVAGPVHQPTPAGVQRVDVRSAAQMHAAVFAGLPCDAYIGAAAVADFTPRAFAAGKLKKTPGQDTLVLELVKTRDILAEVAAHAQRPRLVVGFAAETEKVIEHATEKRRRKGADWIVANDVSGDVMGGEVNAVHIVTGAGVESLPEMPKDQVAMALAERIADALAAK